MRITDDCIPTPSERKTKQNHEKPKVFETMSHQNRHTKKLEYHDVGHPSFQAVFESAGSTELKREDKRNYSKMVSSDTHSFLLALRMIHKRTQLLCQGITSLPLCCPDSFAQGEQSLR